MRRRVAILAQTIAPRYNSNSSTASSVVRSECSRTLVLRSAAIVGASSDRRSASTSTPAQSDVTRRASAIVRTPNDRIRVGTATAHGRVDVGGGKRDTAVIRLLLGVVQHRIDHGRQIGLRNTRRDEVLLLDLLGRMRPPHLGRRTFHVRGIGGTGRVGGRLVI